MHHSYNTNIVIYICVCVKVLQNTMCFMNGYRMSIMYQELFIYY